MRTLQGILLTRFILDLDWFDRLKAFDPCG